MGVQPPSDVILLDYVYVFFSYTFNVFVIGQFTVKTFYATAMTVTNLLVSVKRKQYDDVGPLNRLLPKS